MREADERKGLCNKPSDQSMINATAVDLFPKISSCNHKGERKFHREVRQASVRAPFLSWFCSMAAAHSRLMSGAHEVFEVVLMKLLLKACLWRIDSLLLHPHIGSSWFQGLRPRKKAKSDGFFLLIPSQGQEGLRRLKEKDASRQEHETKNILRKEV